MTCSSVFIKLAPFQHFMIHITLFRVSVPIFVALPIMNKKVLLDTVLPPIEIEPMPLSQMGCSRGKGPDNFNSFIGVGSGAGVCIGVDVEVGAGVGVIVGDKADGCWDSLNCSSLCSSQLEYPSGGGNVFMALLSQLLNAIEPNIKLTVTITNNSLFILPSLTPSTGFPPARE